MQDVYQDGVIATNFEVLQDYYCLHMLLAPMKEKKVTHQAWIAVFSARDYSTIDINSCIILALIAQPSNQL